MIGSEAWFFDSWQLFCHKIMCFSGFEIIQRGELDLHSNSCRTPHSDPFPSLLIFSTAVCALFISLSSVLHFAEVAECELTNRQSRAADEHKALCRPYQTRWLNKAPLLHRQTMVQKLTGLLQHVPYSHYRSPDLVDWTIQTSWMHD